MTDTTIKASILILIWATIVYLIICIKTKIREHIMEREFQKGLQRHLDKIGGRDDDNKRDDK